MQNLFAVFYFDPQEPPYINTCARKRLERPSIILQGSSRQVGGRMLLKKISQILAASGDISTIEEELILTAIWKITKKKFQDQHEEYDMDEIKQPWNTIDAEFKKLCTLPDIVYSSETNHQLNMVEEDIQIRYDEEEYQQIYDHIE